jgi:NOL1/NOP2/fmu family ribosome biogenesis protein
LPTALLSHYLILDKVLKTKWFGTTMGEIKGKDMVPHHALSQSFVRAHELPVWNLSLRQALLFLKKETFDLPDGAPLGWTMAAFEGLPLGWLKLLPNRMNNYLPPERRIRMEVER